MVFISYDINLFYSFTFDFSRNMQIVFIKSKSQHYMYFWSVMCEYEHVSPHRLAQRISALNFFLYLRISGASLWGRMLVGLTFTTEPFLWGRLMHGSHLPFTDRQRKRFIHVIYTLTFFTCQWASDMWTHVGRIPADSEVAISAANEGQ